QEAVAGQPHKERAKAGAVLEVPGGVLDPLEHVGPDRLDDIHRVELGAKGRPDLAPDQHAEIRFVGSEDLFGRGRVAAVELLEQAVERLRAHASSEAQRPGRPGTLASSSASKGEDSSSQLLPRRRLRTTSAIENETTAATIPGTMLVGSPSGASSVSR